MLLQLLTEIRRYPEVARALRDELNAADPDRKVSAAEFAEDAGRAVKTVERWCREGRVPGAEKKGRGWRIPANAPVLPAEPKVKASATAGPGRQRARRLAQDPAGQAAIDRLRGRTPASA